METTFSYERARYSGGKKKEKEKSENEGKKKGFVSYWQ